MALKKFKIFDICYLTVLTSSPFFKDLTHHSRGTQSSLEKVNAAIVAKLHLKLQIIRQKPISPWLFKIILNATQKLHKVRLGKNFGHQAHA